ncbi:MAG: cyclic pyranopterin monophosphate synthase MoaC [Microbacterium sp.]|nr:MAG: cyclic pyranopterin monophosphate synthase MoaC [Microbacterium sp.]
MDATDTTDLGTPDAPNAPTPDAGDLTHQRPDGAVHMVDVSEKDLTRRSATAQAVLTTRPDVVARIADGDLPKGEAIAVARVAGIQAAKQTSTLIPLCHPLPISAVTVEITPRERDVLIEATVVTTGRTGVEMEALTAASVAALTLYDMIKAVDRAAVIGEIAVLEKSGGRSGAWSRS